MRPTRSLAAYVLVAVVSVAGCGGPEPPQVPRPAGQALTSCPPPLTFRPDQIRPTRVRFDNPTADTLTVFIDRCRHHTRLADIAPGRWAQVPLPDRLVAFPEGLRFHAFDLGEYRRVGTYTTAVVAEPILRVRLGEEEIVPDSTLVRLDPGEGQESVGAFAVSEDFGGYAAVWARHSAAILTWSCGEDGRRYVTISTADKLAGDRVDVSLVVGVGRPEPMGAWEVQEGVTDAVVVPEASVDTLTRIALGAAELSFVLADAADVRRAHTFQTRDLREALAGHACFASLLAGR